MGTLTYPFTLTAGANENVNDLNSNLTAIQTVVNGGIDATNLATNAVTTTKITALNVTDAKIASANNAVYRNIATGGAFVGAGSVAGATVYFPRTDGAQWVASGTNGTVAFPVISFLDTDHTVGSLTTKLRMRLTVATNATAPAATFTVGLYPVATGAGAIGTITPTLGTIVTSSGASVASASTTGVSSDFTLASGTNHYTPGLVVSVATTAANSFSLLTWTLQMRHT